MRTIYLGDNGERAFLLDVFEDGTAEISSAPSGTHQWLPLVSLTLEGTDPAVTE